MTRAVLPVDRPYVKVRREGRIEYSVKLYDPTVQFPLYGGLNRYHHILGRHRAERFAERLLARYRREKGWKTEATVVLS